MEPKKKRKYPAASARQQKQKERFLKVLGRTGNIEMTCNKLKIARTNIYRWQKEDVQFARDVDEAISAGTDVMNDFVESVLFDSIRNKNLSATKYYLSNKHPSYSPKATAILAQKQESQEKPLTPEEEKEVERMLDIFNQMSNRGCDHCKVVGEVSPATKTDGDI